MYYHDASMILLMQFITLLIVPAVHEAVYDGTVQYHTMLIISLLTSLLLYTRIPNFPTLLALGFRSDSPEWYDQLYRGLRMNAIVECIKRGGKVTKKAVGVSKKAMRECLLFLLLQHNESLGYQERAIIFIYFVSRRRTWRGRGLVQEGDFDTV